MEGKEASSELFSALSNYLNYGTRKSKVHIRHELLRTSFPPSSALLIEKLQTTVFDGSVEYLSFFSKKMNSVAEKEEEMVVCCITSDDAHYKFDYLHSEEKNYMQNFILEKSVLSLMSNAVYVNINKNWWNITP